jgi:hypothetical protein
MSSLLLTCVPFSPSAYVQLSQAANLQKTGGHASGTSILAVDTAVPFDCAPGPGTTTTTGPLTLTPLAENHNEDSAAAVAALGVADSCSDYEELGATASQGGLRDPFNPYDFYDVNGDKFISLPADILAVAAAFGGSGGPNYHPSKDRGSTIGPNSWNKNGPDGYINVPDDITGVQLQFGHSCVAAPN